MGTPKNKHQCSDQELRYQRRINVAFLVVLIFLCIALWRIPTLFRVHTAPDVTKSFMQEVNEMPAHAVYGFARSVWERLNYCESDCGKEFLERIQNNRAYLTQSCQYSLTKHFRDSGSLYNFRSRLLLPTDDLVFNPKNIQRMSNDMWYVKLTYRLTDEVNGVMTRDNIILYPLKIIRSGKPVSDNPMGMEIDCYFGDGPVVLKRRKIEEEQ